MPAAVCSEEHFIDLCRTHRSCKRVADALRVSEQSVDARRRRVERKLGIKIDLGGVGRDGGPDKRSRIVREREQNLADEVRSLVPKVSATRAQRERARAPTHNPDDVEHFPSEWRYRMTVRDGVVLIGSDAHYAPGVISTAHRAFVALTKELRPVRMSMPPQRLCSSVSMATMLAVSDQGITMV